MEPAVIVLHALETFFYAVVLLLISFGLNLSYGVTKLLNISHGGLISISGYVAAAIIVSYTSMLGIYAALMAAAIAVLAAVLISFVLEPLVFRPSYLLREEHQLIITFGLLLVLEDLTRIIWGSSPIPAREPVILIGNVKILSISYPFYNVAVIIAGSLIALALWFTIHSTRWGKIVRAFSSDPETANAIGVNTWKIFKQVILFSASLAGLAGGIIIPITTATPGIGFEMLLLALLVIVIGGLGSIKGAFIGSILTSAIRTVVVLLFPKTELVILYGIAAVILIIKPKGLASS
ncbi:MAG: branched-chain amino acid ABC transporter permease [Candidatus Caldarchaeum sp.]